MEQRAPRASPPKMQTFNSGTCAILCRTETDSHTPLYTSLRFEDRVIGYARYYTALQDQYQITRLIRIPKVPEEILAFHHLVEIGGKQYEIVQAGHKPDTLPPCIEISLRQPQQFLE